MAKMSTGKFMRLDKFLSSQMQLSRNEVKEFIKKRQVKINDNIAKMYDTKINAETDVISVNDTKIVYREYIYIMMNKPKDVVCSTKDGVSTTVLELVPEELRRKGLFPAGRLDKDTEGFVFITDDGELAHNMLSPKKHVDKKYFAVLRDDADESYITAFEEGMKIDGGDVCKPAKIEICDKKNEVFITISEGMYHQIKRMISCLGNEVVYLKRLQIGGVCLDENLALGECREMLHKEIELLSTK